MNRHLPDKKQRTSELTEEERTTLNQVKKIIEDSSEELIIGNIALKSAKSDIPELIKFAKDILKDSSCRNYLIDLRNKNSGYFG